MRHTGAKCVNSGRYSLMIDLSLLQTEVEVRSHPVMRSTGSSAVLPTNLTACVRMADPEHTSRNQYT